MPTWHVRAAALGAAFLVALGACTGSPSPPDSPITGNGLPKGSQPPDIVFLLTDDQRWDTLNVMPTVEHELAGKGVRFSNAFVVNPLCCPSRASILTGKYSHGTGVYSNLPPLGGFKSFDPSSTIATWLHRAGYRTGLIGKYLNGYKESLADYVAPGWDRWLATTGDAYYRFGVSDQGTWRFVGKDPANYSTKFLAGEAVKFIHATDRDQPLFLYLAFHAPHEPAIPAPGDEKALTGLAPLRPPNYNEPDVSDKPAWIKEEPSIDARRQGEIDRLRHDMLGTLLDVDRAVKAVIDALSQDGRLGRSLIVFSSDNGYLWGEHRLKGKSAPYEESIRVPLVVRYDPLVKRPRTDGHLVANIDFAPTFANAAGVPAPGADGASLLALLASPTARWRQNFLVEHAKLKKSDPPTFCQVRSTRYSYILYGTGERELYDLTADPFELSNRVRDPALASTAAGMRDRLRQLCDPPPPGLTVP